MNDDSYLEGLRAELRGAEYHADPAHAKAVRAEIHRVSGEGDSAEKPKPARPSGKPVNAERAIDRAPRETR